MSDVIHDSTERYAAGCDFPHVLLGVLVIDDGETVEIETHAPRLWNCITGQRVPAGDAEPAIAESLRSVIAGIDKAVAELTRQRERLAGLAASGRPH